MRLHLIDVSGFVYRSYWAIRGGRDKAGMVNPAGQHVEALYGYTRMVNTLVRRLEREGMPDLVAAVFDPKGGRGSTFRSEIFARYKANRQVEPDLAPQFQMVRDVTPLLGLPAVEVPGFEADDLIASYAEAAKLDGVRVTIVSSDKDLMQLVDEPAVMMADPMKEMKVIGRAEVIEKFGVPPEQVVDVQAIIGDTTDNVPGVHGIGEVGAAEIIKQWGCLETALSRVDQLSKKYVAKMKANEENAIISKKLVTLKRDVELPVPLPELTYAGYQPSLRSFLERHDFKSILEDLRGLI